MTLCIIQARLGSTRFPRKALALLNGKPVLEHVVDRAWRIPGVDNVVVAAPAGDSGELAAVIDGATVYGPDVPEGDVLRRFAAVAQAFPNADTIMRLTGDCPLIDPAACGRVLASLHCCEYAWIDTATGWPDGLDCEVFSRNMLMRAAAEATDPSDREHVTPWIRRHGDARLPVDPTYRDWPKVSVDTKEDLARVEAWMQRH